MPLLRRLVQRRPRPVDVDFDEPEVRSVVVMARSEDAFYYNLTDEEFCEWARAWSSGPQVLSARDRDRIMGRLRRHSSAWGYMEV